MALPKKEKRKNLYRQHYEDVETSLKNEPILMRAKRVEQILDIESSTRKRLVNSGDLTALKTGGSVSSAMRITKESVIKIIATWLVESENKRKFVSTLRRNEK